MAAAEPLITGPALLWLVGGGALALGVLVYLTDRPVASAPLLLSLLGLQGTRPWFGALGGWLPSFVHPLAFSLFSAALLTPQPRWQYSACGFWFAVNAAFEIGQHPQLRGPLADALRQEIGQGTVARAVENYFLLGTFDPGDLAAAAFGAALAACILRVHRETRHAD